MPDPTDYVDVPAGAWTRAAEGPCEALITGNDNFEFAYAETQPSSSDSFGHHRFAHADLVVTLPEDMSVWAFNALRPMRLAVTVEPA